MNTLIRKPKAISVTFRGFSISAEEVVGLVGLRPELFGNKGEPKRLGFKTVLNKSYAIFSKNLLEESNISDDLTALVLQLGGIDEILLLQKKINPEFTEFNFYLPSRTSEIIQDGYLSQENIEVLYKLRATVGFNFF